MEKFDNPNKQINQRTKAAIFDAACFGVIFFLLNLLSSFIFGTTESYKSAYDTVMSHIEYSNLSKYDEENGFMNYSGSELYQEQDGSLVFTNVLSYYYLNYLSNTNIKTDLQGSRTIVSHDIKWFNEEILEINKNTLFVTKTSSPESISTEIGVFNEECLYSIGLNGVYEFMETKYTEASNNFFALDFIKEANDTMNAFGGWVVFISSFGALLTVYLLIPAIKKNRQTFGKRIFGVVVVKFDEIVKVPVLLLRAVPAALVCGLITIINQTGIELAIIVGALLISSGLMLFTKSKVAIHDLVAGTRVITLEEYKEIKEAKDANK